MTGWGQLEICSTKLLTLGKNDSLFYAVLKFAYVSAPSMSFQLCFSFFRKAVHFTTVSSGIFRYEHFRKRSNLVLSFPKGREVQMHCVYPVIKVFTEFSVADHLLEVPVGCTDQAYVDRNGLCVTDAGDCPVLERS